MEIGKEIPVVAKSNQAEITVAERAVAAAAAAVPLDRQPSGAVWGHWDRVQEGRGWRRVM